MSEDISCIVKPRGYVQLQLYAVVKFGKRLNSAVAKVPVTYQNDHKK